MQLGTKGADLCRRIGEAFAKKGGLLSFWQETADNFYPERADFTTMRSMGEDFVSSLYASEPILFRRDFGNYISAALRPKGRTWFVPRARDSKLHKNTSVRTYLEEKGDVTLSLFRDRKSNFSNAMRQGDHDWVTFGNSVTTGEVRRDGMGLLFRTWHLRDVAWATNYDGEIDTVYRRIMVSLRNLCSREKEAEWSIHPRVKERLEKNPEEQIEIHHVMMPAAEYDPMDKALKLKWMSIYIDTTNQWEMSAKNVRTFNYAISRWFTVDTSPYAFSPCVICALPDGRSLQTMTWSIIEAGEKAVEPPMVAVNEAVLSGVDLRAGMVTWVDNRYDERTGEAVRAIELGGSPQFGEAIRQGITGNLKEAFYLNKLFLPNLGVQMTAEEIMRRHEEFLRVAQPVIEPAENERNGPILDMAIELAQFAGLWGDLKEMPKELIGKETDYTYDNPLEDAQRQSKSNAYRSSMEIVASTKQLMDPAIVENFDGDQAFRDAIGGVAPPNWLRSEDAAAQAVDGARKMAAVNSAAQQAADLAGAAGKAGMAMPQQAAA